MVASTQPNTRQAEHYQDSLIAQAMPTWLRKASVAQLDQLQEASALSLYWRERSQQVLSGLQGIEAFCRPRLQHALSVQFPGVEQTTTSWREGHREPVVTSQPIGYPVTTAVYRTRPLLEAALANFTAEQAEPGGMLVGNRLQRAAGLPAQPLPDAASFARFCRTLDLGGQYQRHVHEVLETSAAEEVSPRSVLSRHLRYALLVEAHRAWIEGHLDALTHRLLTDVCTLRLPTADDATTLRVGRLRLLGYTLERIVVVDGGDFAGYAEGMPSQPVLVYIPGDAHGALRGYPSLRHFANDLGRRLRTPQYQRFFARFVRRRDSQGFFTAVIEGYDGVGDLGNISLSERVLPCSAPIFDELAQAQIEHIKDDARLIATPVAEIDLQVQREHDRRLAAEGWTLLNLAGLFVPALGAALLAVTAWEVLDETFVGIVAWRQGEHSEAMAHLLNVAAQVATLAALGGAGALASRAWSRSRQVDSLLPHTLSDGRVRLGLARLEGPTQPLPAEAIRDEEGLYRLGEQRWVVLDDQPYPVQRLDEDHPWAIHTSDGVVHPLTHNGAGAWRLWHESPCEWTEPRYLFRRLGVAPTILDDDAIDLILQATGTNADTLRGLHMQGDAIDAVFQDSIERVVLEQRLRALIRQLRGGERVNDAPLLALVRALPEVDGLSDQALAEHLWSMRRAVFGPLLNALQAPASPAAEVLTRDFPGLSRRTAQALVDAASHVERGQLLEEGRVPLRMALEARRSLRRIRVARAYEGLSIDMAQDLDLARLALQLSLRLPSAAEGLGWRLFEGSRDGAPLWTGALAADARMLDVVRGETGFELFDTQGTRLSSAPAELFATLATAFATSEREALGVAEPFAHNLRVLLARQARVDRDAIAHLLGQAIDQSGLRVPTRLADGRLGYLLSGRRAGRTPRGLGAQMRRLYPLMTDQQIDAWAQQVRDSGHNVDQVLTQLGHEMRELERALRHWSSAGAGVLIRNERSRFADHLMATWRRMTSYLFPGAQQHEMYHLRLRRVYLPVLPRLPAGVSFAHVHTLSLQEVGLHDIGPDFLGRFPQLRILELDGNVLRRLPRDLNLLPQLQELSLAGNAINLDEEQTGQLTTLTHLHLLNLADNPLRRTFSVQNMPHLRYLNLRHTEQRLLPAGLTARPNLVLADLRENHIRTLPEPFFTRPRWMSQTILVGRNPLDSATLDRMEAWRESQAGVDAQGTDESAAAVVRDAWLTSLPEQPQLERLAIWEELRLRSEAHGLFDLLDRLRQSADFIRPEAALGQRVWALLDALHASPDLADEVFALANVPLTCQDSAALCFSGLELHLLVWQALQRARNSAGSEVQALIQLGRQLWRLDEVERIALRDIEARHADGADPDQIEVVLAYRVGLREALDLPAQPQDMLFAGVSGVDPARLEQARQAVSAGERRDVLIRSLVQRDFWRTWLERHHADRFEASDMPFQARLAALMEQAEAQAGAEGDYLNQMNAVRDEREASRAALMLTLTEAILDAHAAQ
ncbi:NEL-type E3 ubiquitin ligase domain-containing protein [Pseudomonas phoenicis]|uniref:NEL-type E3 ubiquitin ligase domain-containing protein n=1 Tax=unclassified Pseudomonas TaxID=196821 RepID=UPI0039A14495